MLMVLAMVGSVVGLVAMTLGSIHFASWLACRPPWCPYCGKRMQKVTSNSQACRTPTCQWNGVVFFK